MSGQCSFYLPDTTYSVYLQTAKEKLSTPVHKTRSRADQSKRHARAQNSIRFRLKDQMDTRPDTNPPPGIDGALRRDHGFFDYLHSHGVLDDFALDRAVRAMDQTWNQAEAVLVDLGLMSENDLAFHLAQFLGLEQLSKEDYPIAPVGEGVLDAAFLKTARLLPVLDTETAITLATPRPLNNAQAEAAGYFLNKSVTLKVTAASDFDQLFEQLYSNADGLQTLPAIDADREDQIGQADIDRLKDIASEAPVVRLASRIINQAVSSQASDIHMEPFEDRVRIRFRIDGTLHTMETADRSMLAGLVSRFKIMAHLNIAESRLPQDGRIKIPVRGREIDLRVSTMPTQFGETIVLRILDRAEVTLRFPALGFDADAVETLQRLTAQPHGIFLVTGPTGSGKTTTLYAALSALNSEERKIFTVEDPVEYNLPGISQIQVKPQIGLNFASALRSILRQDPDIVMLGEIRDSETAQISIQASLTGHLVLATVHTNDAISSISRLLDMGVERFLLASTLRGVLAQRLVRRLCQHCSQPADLPAAIVAEAGTGDRNSPHGARRAVGCVACKKTGYAGRTTIYEIVEFDSELQGLVAGNAATVDLVAAVRTRGAATLRQCGLAKVLQGETSLAEVLRVTGDQHTTNPMQDPEVKS